MTREEEILKEAEEFAYEMDIALIKPDNEYAFREGAIWADGFLFRRLSELDLSNSGRLHNIWHGIRQRCNNPKATGYRYYGGKGIKVCKEWDSFVVFAVWATLNGYEENLSIDREDISKDYCPENCRWADAITQANNTSRSHFVGDLTIAQEASANNINYRTLHNRFTRGKMPIEKALNAPPYNPKAVLQYTKEGEFIREYTSAKSACACVGGALGGRGHIDDVCRGKRKSAFGYVWKYKE